MAAVSHEYSEACRCFSCRGFRQAADEDLQRTLERMTAVDAPVVPDEPPMGTPVGEDAPVPGALMVFPAAPVEPLAAYRTPDPHPCPCCEDRRRAEKAMQPFQTPANRHCPECGCDYPRMWDVICRGHGTFSAGGGFWFLRWWGRRVVTCNRPNAPRHLHFVCPACSHTWEMLTRTETS